MKKRRVLIVLFLAAVTVLAVVSELRLRRESASGSAAARLALPEFRPEDVRSLEISWRTQKSTLDFVPDGQYWAVKERAGAQAASAQVADLLEGLAKAAPLKELEISGMDDYKDLNLVSPEEIAAPGAPADLKNSEGIKPFSLALNRSAFLLDFRIAQVRLSRRPVVAVLRCDARHELAVVPQSLFSLLDFLRERSVFRRDSAVDFTHCG